ncbi:hypothetical protein AC626_16660 [Pseudoalteromonas rubra]|uniref:Uncharacterized protein n=1 Tax=Pseudoalteromonas rubra TaxID=43658 RepID=A0A0L0EQ06_9GAMM|nr:hypothetical protein AC626_16660 [Pseudoalteromonas rubra]
MEQQYDKSDMRKLYRAKTGDTVNLLNCQIFRLNGRKPRLCHSSKTKKPQLKATAIEVDATLYTNFT